MTNTTQILPFAIGAGSNVEAPTLWAADPVRETGFQAGIASSTKANTALRQASFVAAMIAQFTADYGPSNVLDDGNVTVFESQFLAALEAAALSGSGGNLLHWCLATGTANALILTSTQPLSAYAAGDTLLAVPALGNTGPATLNADGLGARNIVRPNGFALEAGDITPSLTAFVYDGANFRLFTVPSANFVHRGDDTSSSANTVTATVFPPISAYAKGAVYCIQIANAFTGAAVANFNGLGNRTICRQDGTNVVAGDAVVGEELMLIDTGAKLQLASLGRAEIQRYVANPILYVRTDGNDANDGSANNSGNAFATIAAAIAYGARAFSLTGSSLTVQLGVAGTYAAPGDVTGMNGTLVIRGDPLNQSAYIIAGSAAPTSATIMCFGGLYQFNGVTIRNTGTSNHTLGGVSGASISVLNTTFTCSVTNTVYSHCYAATNGIISIVQGCNFASSLGTMFNASGGSIIVNAVPVTLTGTPAFAVATIFSYSNGVVSLVSGTSFIGGATGTRYSASINGVINTQGAGASFIPGSSAGTTSLGGQYV